MKKGSVLFCGVILTGLFCSCVSTYVKSNLKQEIYTREIQVAAEKLMKAAEHIIPALGYKIDSRVQQEGAISTVPVEMKLKQYDCDCGWNTGAPIIKSTGTKVMVGFVVSADGGTLTVKTAIDYQDNSLAGAMNAGQKFICVSKGTLENKFLRDFMGKMETEEVKALLK